MIPLILQDTGLTWSQCVAWCERNGYDVSCTCRFLKQKPPPMILASDTNRDKEAEEAVSLHFVPIKTMTPNTFSL